MSPKSSEQKNRRRKERILRTKNQKIEQGIMRSSQVKRKNGFKFARQLEYMNIKKQVALKKAQKKQIPLLLDITVGTVGIGAAIVEGFIDIFTPFDFTSSIWVRTPFPVLTKGSQYQKFMEKIQNAFNEIYLS